MLITWLIIVSHNTPCSTYVKGPDYTGYIFNSTYLAELYFPEFENRYTPTDSDIQNAENILLKSIKSDNNDRIN